MIACPRCGRVDDGSSYQCPACYTVLQPDLVNERKPSRRGGSPPGPPPGSAPPPTAAYPPAGSYPPPPGPGLNPDNPYRAPNPPPPPAAPYGGYGGGYRPLGVPDVPTYLPHAILSTLLCCLPFGIVAIVYAAKVGTMQAVGDYEGASRASDQARMWCWISFGLGLVGGLLYFVIMMSMANQTRHY